MELHYPKSTNYTPFTKSESFPDATIEFVGYENGEWNFKVEGSNYELGAQTSDVSSKGCANSAQGQHIHFIDGAAPYLAKYESSFKNEIDDGQPRDSGFFVKIVSREHQN